MNKNDDKLDLQDFLETLENRQPKGIKLPTTRILKTISQIETEKDPLEKCTMAMPTRLEVKTINTKIHSFDKPVFITTPTYKVYTLIGKTPTLRIPEISTSHTEIHIINDDELVYSIPITNTEDPDFYDVYTSEDGVFVICGKNFGTRNLDALASILLKINPYKILVQKYLYDKKNKGAHWVTEYNKQVTKLEHNINKFLRNDDDQKR
jgi:hypothetical protein